MKHIVTKTTAVILTGITFFHLDKPICFGGNLLAGNLVAVELLFLLAYAAAFVLGLWLFIAPPHWLKNVKTAAALIVGIYVFSRLAWSPLLEIRGYCTIMAILFALLILSSLVTYREYWARHIRTWYGLWGELSPQTLLMIFVVLLLSSMASGIVTPNGWAFTHNLFTYQHGFIKRGLIGAMLELIDHPLVYSKGFSDIFGWLLLGINMSLLSLLVYRAIKGCGPLYALFAILFAASASPVFLTYTAGYYDHVGLLATLLVLLISGFWLKFTLATLLFTASMFAHEAGLVIFAPVIFLSMFLQVQRSPLRIALLATYGVFLVGLVFVIGSTSVSESTLAAITTTMQAKTNAPIVLDVINVLGMSGSENMALVQEKWQRIPMATWMLLQLAHTLPTVILFVWAQLWILRSRRYHRRWIPATIVASCSAYLLYIFGMDLGRWNTLVILTSFLLLTEFFWAEKDIALSMDSKRAWVIPAGMLVVFILNRTTAMSPIFGPGMKWFPYF